MYLLSSTLTLISYSLSLSLVEYQTAILRDDQQSAEEILSSIPKDQLGKVSRFLEGRGQLEEARRVAEKTGDKEYLFDLALKGDDLDAALEILRAIEASSQKPEKEGTFEPSLESVKWKTLGDRALKIWNFPLAKEAFERAGDLNSLFLLFLATGEKEQLSKVAKASGLLFSLWRHSSVLNFWCSRKGPQQPGIRLILSAWRCSVLC